MKPLNYLFILNTLIHIYSISINAQQTDCNKIYFLTTATNTVWEYNPSSLITASNPSNTGISVTNGVSGLTIAKRNINTGQAVQTMYYATSGRYHYYDNAAMAWVNTNHFHSGLVTNLGAGNNIVYNFNPIDGNVHTYNGLSDDVFLVNVPTFSNTIRCADIVTDCEDNFYIIDVSPTAIIYKYSSTGNLLKTYNVMGLPINIGGHGFSLVNNVFYVGWNNSALTAELYKGECSGGNVNFSLITSDYLLNSGGGTADLASCPSSFLSNPNAVSEHTLSCSQNTTNVSISYCSTEQASYNWSGPSIISTPTNSIITVDAIGIYTCVTTDINSCNIPSTITVNVVGMTSTNPIIITSPILSFIEKGESITLTANSSVGNYSWTPSNFLSCNNCPNPIAKPIISTEYCVETIDAICNTKSSTCIQINVNDNCAIKNLNLPNSFSPNGDGKNDFFCLQGNIECIKKAEITIYNRWGEKVFTSFIPSFCWDGNFKSTFSEIGVYVYYLKVESVEGLSFEKKSNLTLIK